ncbi:hypothetical protein A3H09_02930 [Candidatus Falkowbacteria bacterium RIFCSPLOWO2_12_FULL_45_13]|uniref:Sortase n=1 Tax=Candidatus Falkowbacteria bacterium RIFCSPLOWO2_12_FULL_45_13 TaxID=1797991 RepID=A0A1F5STF1_9BACT|nr:MAG: hypothetical protein A3H09_02930 [Candidatus Falkowbacteria bacterium RIFCSPLOWO2_12_FULL_45_13]
MLKDNNKILKALVFILELLAIGLAAYLIIMPVWPALKYKYFQLNQAGAAEAPDPKKTASQTEPPTNPLPAAEENISLNRLLIAKIGVNAPIVEAKNSEIGLSRGAWRIPESSTPDHGGNTVITGHRFKYLPPNNLTFYLLDKLITGDLVSLSWKNKIYNYRIKETKIVPASEVSILEPTAQPTLTLYTCDPIFSKKNRLVVIGELMEEKP